MKRLLSLHAPHSLCWMLIFLLVFSSVMPTGWCSGEQERLQPLQFSQAYSDEKILHFLQTVQSMWTRTLIFIIELRGYRETQKNIWVRREPYATYRYNGNTGEWLFIYEINPLKPRKGWDSPLVRLFATPEHDFSGQVSRFSIRFGGYSGTQGSM